jgi:transketolase
MEEMVEIDFLKEKANKIRKVVIEMLVAAGSGHTAGPMGSVEFFVAMYLGELLKIDPNNPNGEERDRLVVSPGHYAPVVYTVLAESGFFLKEELMSLRKFESRLQGHPIKGELPGIENCSGSLGQGLSVAVGMALGARLQGKKWKTVAFLSDGEHDEGQTWEAYMLAAKEGLDNLVIFVDYNNIQIDGFGETVMPLEPLVDKLRSFNLEVMEIDGNNLEQVINAYRRAEMIKNKPSVVVMRTIPGKGVGFMENSFEWHGKVPTVDEGKRAIKELESK